LHKDERYHNGPLVSVQLQTAVIDIRRISRSRYLIKVSKMNNYIYFSSNTDKTVIN
jgi:hypothetical protein